MPEQQPQNQSQSEYCICGHSVWRHHSFTRSCMADCDCDRFTRKETMNTHTAYTGVRDPINCPANQPNPATGEEREAKRDIKDMTWEELMQDASEIRHRGETGEWTVERIAGYATLENGNELLAEDINAALAAKPATGQRLAVASEWTVEGKAIWDGGTAIGCATSEREAYYIASAHNAAIAAEESKNIALHDRLICLEEQLAAEQEKRESIESINKSLAQAVDLLRAELAAEKENSKNWKEEHWIEVQHRLKAEKQLAAALVDAADRRITPS